MIIASNDSDEQNEGKEEAQLLVVLILPVSLSYAILLCEAQKVA